MFTIRIFQRNYGWVYPTAFFKDKLTPLNCFGYGYVDDDTLQFKRFEDALFEVCRACLHWIPPSEECVEVEIVRFLPEEKEKARHQKAYFKMKAVPLRFVQRASLIGAGIINLQSPNGVERLKASHPELFEHGECPACKLREVAVKPHEPLPAPDSPLEKDEVEQEEQPEVDPRDKPRHKRTAEDWRKIADGGLPERK